MGELSPAVEWLEECYDRMAALDYIDLAAFCGVNTTRAMVQVIPDHDSCCICLRYPDMWGGDGAMRWSPKGGSDG